MRWFDPSIDEAIIANFELSVHKLCGIGGANQKFKAIPDIGVTQRRAYIFIEPSHRYVGVFDPKLLDTKGNWVANALLIEPSELSIYVLENANVVDFYTVAV